MVFFRLTELFYCLLKNGSLALNPNAHPWPGFTDLGTLYFTLKIQHENSAATQVPKRGRTWILEERKHNF